MLVQPPKWHDCLGLFLANTQLISVSASMHNILLGYIHKVIFTVKPDYDREATSEYVDIRVLPKRNLIYVDLIQIMLT